MLLFLVSMLARCRGFADLRLFNHLALNSTWRTRKLCCSFAALMQSSNPFFHATRDLFKSLQDCICWLRPETFRVDARGRPKLGHVPMDFAEEFATKVD